MAAEQVDTETADTSHSSIRAAGVVGLDASEDSQAEGNGGHDLSELIHGRQSGRGQDVPTCRHRFAVGDGCEVGKWGVNPPHALFQWELSITYPFSHGHMNSCPYATHLTRVWIWDSAMRY
jgi:hypothetical protein